MSLDKAIESGKEHRKQYRGCQAFDPGCRCHGGCTWCRDNRMHRTEKRMPVDDNGNIIGKHPKLDDENILETSIFQTQVHFIFMLSTSVNHHFVSQFVIRMVWSGL